MLALPVVLHLVLVRPYLDDLLHQLGFLTIGHLGYGILKLVLLYLVYSMPLLLWDTLVSCDE